MSAYLLPDGLDLDRALASHLDVQAEPARTTALTFYDTFDGRLHAAGLTLRHGDGRLSVIDREAAAELVAAPLEDAPGTLFDRDLPPALRTRLAPIIEMRALIPLATVATRSRKLAILNDDEKTVVRLSEEVPNGLRTRVQTLPVRGYDKDLLRVQKVLTVSLGLTKTDEPLVDEAIAATGALPAGTSSKLDVALARGQSAGAAAEAVLARTHAIAEANLPGTLDDVDSEFLHDLRVAVRRARSLLRELKTVFPERELERLREDLKWVQLITGEARDLDVQLLDFADYEDREPARSAPHRARAQAREGADDDEAAAHFAPRHPRIRRLGRAARHRQTRPRSRRSRPSGSPGSTRRCSRWAGRSTTTPSPRPCTSCARRARSCATCSSSSAACSTRTSSSR